MIDEKYKKLKSILLDMKEAVIAYSGGVDSTFLLKVATDVLGNKAKGVLAVSPTYPERELGEAKRIAKKIGAYIDVIETNELENEEFASNPVNRCYFCKSELFAGIQQVIDSGLYKNMVDGSNFDDLDDHRPGMIALREKDVRSPLQEAELTKNDIRDLSKQLGLPTWEKDAMACLSSRFPYGEKITKEKLRKVDRAEEILLNFGFNNIRARHQKETVKIEVNTSQISKFFETEIRTQIVSQLKSLGYKYVTLDLEGYRMGSMNEVL
jgi:uncharacterized protein